MTLRCRSRADSAPPTVWLLLALLGACDDAPGKGGPGDPGDDTATDTDGACVLTAALAADRVSGELPLTVHAEASVACAAGEATLAWDFDDGASATGDAATHTFLASGDHTITLTATDAAGDTATATATVSVRAATCPELEDAVVLGTAESADLTEASGLAEGIVNPGVLWSHNDSGDTPRLFALDPDGTHRGTFLLDGAAAGDWEDLAIGVDAASGAAVLYAGDIGANGAARDTLSIFVVPEPLLGDSTAEQTVSDWTTVTLAFPDGPARDANTLLLDPVTGDLYLAAAEADGTIGVWRAAAPLSAGTTVTLELVAALSLDEAAAVTPSGGAMSPLGDRMLIRTDDRAWLWLRDQAAGIDAAWAAAPCPIPLPAEPRGESIAFSADGGGFYTLSEEAYQPIWFTAFIPPCDGVEPRIVVTADSYAIPFEPVFSVDATCVAAGVASVEWDFGDGSEASSEAAPTHRYLASGTYTVAVRVTDADGATGDASVDIAVVPAACPTPGETVEWGELESDDITEASGLGHSAANPGVVWTHNDSGGEPRLFAVGEDGGHLGTFTIETSSRDWEDMSLGWDATLGGPAIYVGDLGDNGASRASITVLVVPEPFVDPTAEPVSEAIAAWSSLTLTYPDGAHNAESLAVDPVTGDLYVVTKHYEGEAFIFRKAAPHVNGESAELELVAELLFGTDPLDGAGATTAADFSPLGDGVAIRTYSHAWLWRRDQADTMAETFAGEACDLRAPTEPQGEALTFSRDGAGYLLVSEGDHQPLLYTPLE